jgi:hypothetical protein
MKNDNDERLFHIRNLKISQIVIVDSNEIIKQFFHLMKIYLILVLKIESQEYDVIDQQLMHVVFLNVDQINE